MRDFWATIILLILTALFPKPPHPAFSADAADRVLYYAFLYEGHTEVTHNRSPYIDYWLGRLGIPPGHNYCAAFVAFILDTANVVSPEVRSAVARDYRTIGSTPASEVLAGRYQVPRGSILVWGRTGSWTGHVDFASEDWKGSDGMAIGANVSPPGEYDEGRGYGVFNKRRHIVAHAYFRITHITEVR